MTERTEEKSYNICERPEEHRDHMCHLMEKGKTAEIRRRSTDPRFVCGNCGARAHEKEDLCNPGGLQEG